MIGTNKKLMNQIFNINKIQTILKSYRVVNKFLYVIKEPVDECISQFS